jgi:hypothetical protein
LSGKKEEINKIERKLDIMRSKQQPDIKQIKQLNSINMQMREYE